MKGFELSEADRAEIMQKASVLPAGMERASYAHLLAVEKRKEWEAKQVVK